MPTVSPFVTKLLIGLRGSIKLRLPLVWHKSPHASSIVACIFSIGERTEAQVIESLHKQSLPLSHIELVNNISPISTASNRALEIARDSDYLLWVDADMILYAHCTEDLMRLMRPDTLYAVGTLMDPVFGKVGYIKLLNMYIVRRLNLRFRDVLGCDVDFCRQAQEKDRNITLETFTLLREPLGVHHPTYTAKELFRKNQIEKKKRGNRTDAKLLLMLARKHLASSNPVLLAGMLGEILPNPDQSEGESVPESGLHHWDMAKRLLKDIPDDLTYGFSNK
jgi:hypothetical protein